MYKLHLGSNKDVLKTFAENSVDSIVTDPPYELGFMGKAWDSTGIAYDVELWKECLRVLKPGGYILAFSGTRTYHRMAVAIEDAGFEIRDEIEWLYSTDKAFADFFDSLNNEQQKILDRVVNNDSMLHWCYGSGFPKSHNIGKKVDEIQGNEREVMPNPKAKQQTASKDGIYGDYESTTHISKGTSEFEGWGTALKPAHEPICMARKPLSEKTVAENCLKWGTGGINIDISRIENNSENESDKRFGTDAKYNGNTDNEFFKTLNNKGTQVYNSQGRFPANLITDGSEEVRECFPETKSGVVKEGYIRKANNENITYGSTSGTQMSGFGDSGNASRFFKSIPQGRFPANLIHDNSEEVRECFPETKAATSRTTNKTIGVTNFKAGEAGEVYNDNGGNASRFFKSIIYQAKPSKAERNRGCEAVFNLFEQSEGLEEKQVFGDNGGTYKGLSNSKIPSTNNHPTVKPIALMEYLIKMVTPKGGIVLDPFNGSGSTGCAAVKNRFDYIGIDITEDYIKISEKRIKSYQR